MLPGESEDWQAGQPCQSCKRALQMSLLCSVKPKRRKEGPVTTDNCQLNGTLTLGRPMSSNGGDKCLANQLAYKNHSSSQHCPHQHMKWQHAQSSTLAFSACACVCVCVSVCVCPSHLSQCYWYCYKGSDQYSKYRNKNQAKETRNQTQAKKSLQQNDPKGNSDKLTYSELVCSEN